jgi:mannosyltransferase OCH1-like enzyme
LIFHHIWLGDKPFDPRCRMTWMNHYPDATFMFWNDENMISLYNQDCFDSAKTMAQKSDIARYEILGLYGGIYVDCDMECLRRFDIPKDFVAMEDSVYIGTAIIGCSFGSELLHDMVRYIDKNFDPTKPVNENTGPVAFTKVFDSKKRDIPTYGPSEFYPIGFDGVVRGDIDKAYTNHLWSHSWK